jgi:hypothetical protein
VDTAESKLSKPGALGLGYQTPAIAGSPVQIRAADDAERQVRGDKLWQW